MIYKTSHRMSVLYYIPFEEVLCQANTLFMSAYLEYDPHTAECRFSTWLQNILFWRLTDWCKHEYRHNCHAELDEALHVTVHHKHCWLHDLMSLVGDEARVVIQAIVSSPKELKNMMRRHHFDEGEYMPAEGKAAIKEVLIRYLKQLGWLPHEVKTGFKEISNILEHGMPEDPKPKKVHKKCKLTKGQVYLLTRQYR